MRTTHEYAAQRLKEWRHQVKRAMHRGSLSQCSSRRFPITGPMRRAHGKGMRRSSRIRPCRYHRTLPLMTL